MDVARKCRFCLAPLRQVFVDLGSMPLANSYLNSAALEKQEPLYPLVARVCASCFLVQVDDVVPAETIFSDYAYFSSYSAAWVEHARRYAETMCRRLQLNSHSKVVEIASNDGYLLQHFVAAGIPVLGVEPAGNTAAVARSKGIPTEAAFFGRRTAEDLASRGHAADLIVANNVLAHVPDINDFVSAFKLLLRPQGIATFEFPHFLRLVEGVQFDTIYHEHFSYLSLLSAERIFARHGLHVFDAESLPTHGGSLRLFVAHTEARRSEGPGLAPVRRAEAAAGLERPEGYWGFQARVDAVRSNFLRFLDAMKRQGCEVAAYGAAAKGNTLLNYCGVKADRIAYVVDRNPHKQGMYLPGSHLPIFPPDRIFDTRPDYVVILPWNLVDEIAGEMAAIGEWGGKFVTALPEIRIFKAAAA